MSRLVDKDKKMARYGLYRDLFKLNLYHIYLPGYHDGTALDLCGSATRICIKTFDSVYDLETREGICQDCLGLYTMLELAQ